MQQSSVPPSFTCFNQLPPEVQDHIWGFALPRRTVYLQAADFSRDQPRLPRHNAPAVAHASRDARAVATRTGRWLWFGPRRAKSQQRQRELQDAPRDDCPEPVQMMVRKRILWFDAARDTILIAGLRLWPQDIEANPVALEMRLPIPRPILMPTCDEGADDAANNNNNNNKTAVTGFTFTLDTELSIRQSGGKGENYQLLYYFPRLPLEGLFQSSLYSPAQDITGGDRRLWPGHCYDDDASSATTAAEPPAYTDIDLEVVIERPLAPEAHDEFFPEGSLTCFIDLSALEPMSSSPPPHLSSYSYSYSSPTKPPAANPHAHPHNAPVVTRQALTRLLHAYTRTQDLDRKANLETVKLLQRLLLREETTPSAKPKEKIHEAFFEKKRRAIAFKWLRINWNQLSRKEQEGAYMAGAARCCSSSPSPLPWTSLRGLPEPSSLLPGPEVPTSAQPSVVYRMPRPWMSAFAFPRDFNTEHPWTRAVLGAMPRLRLGLLLRFRGEAAAVATGEPNAHWLGRRRNVGGAAVVKGGASL